MLLRTEVLVAKTLIVSVFEDGCLKTYFECNDGLGRNVMTLFLETLQPGLNQN